MDEEIEKPKPSKRNHKNRKNHKGKKGKKNYNRKGKKLGFKEEPVNAENWKEQKKQWKK